MLEQTPFKRRYLAQAYCDSLSGMGITDARSGLFLAGPRRVGKTTFVLSDLIPEVESRDWLPVYIDLWMNKQTDPACLIIEALKKIIFAQKNKLNQLAQNIRLEKINWLKTLEIDFSKPGLPDDINLVDLLNELIQLTNKPIALIIDEAQHALTSTDGLNAMFSLKSARDQINLQSSSMKIMLVFTGSNRDKLAQLVLKREQPFFGASITDFPLLGRDFSDYFTEKVNKALRSNNQFTKESMWEAFKLVGHRPEVLQQIVGQLAIRNEASCFAELLQKDALVWKNQFWQVFENEYNALLPLQKAILKILIEKERAWSPFSEESMGFYKQEIQQPGLTAATVQSAIQALREKGFIWQSSRGSYALEDESFAEWFKHTMREE